MKRLWCSLFHRWDHWEKASASMFSSRRCGKCGEVWKVER